MTKKGRKGDDAVSGTGLDPKTVEDALACGLYGSLEELTRDIFGGKEPDDFTRLAAQHTLADQMKAKCYGDLLDMKGVRTITIAFKRKKEAVEARGAVVINGPGRNGYLILENRKSVMISVKMRGEMWTRFVGVGDSFKHTTANVLAHSIGAPLRTVHEAVERAVRTCGSPEWHRVDSFPVDVSTIDDKFLAELLASTPFGARPSVSDAP